jgi:hypothetical protein
MAESKSNIFTSTLKNIKDTLFGKGVDKDSIKVDKIIDDLPERFLSKDAFNNSSLFADMLSKKILDTNDQIFKKVGPNITDKGRKDRLNRYINADEICDNIPYCSRALQVLTSEILSPDDITKESILILDSEVQLDNKNDIEDIISIKESLNIDDNISDIIQNTLKYGDYFVEICNIDSNDVPITSTILQEGYVSGNSNNNSSLRINKQIELEKVNPNLETRNKITIDLQLELITSLDPLFETSKEDSENVFKKNRKRSDIDINKIKLVLHDPNSIIKIQSLKNKLCLGYLVLPQSGSQSDDTNLVNMFSYNNANTGIDELYDTIIDHIKKFSSDDPEFKKGEFKDILKKVLIDYENTKKGKVKVRFVPNGLMEHFHLGNRFFPYGESIFYRSTFQAKILIALETAISIKRLSDAVEKRAIYFETGMGISRKERNVIEDLKQELKKRKYSLDTFGNIGSIPSMVNSFEDWFIPQKNGSKMLEFDLLNKQVDARSMADELKFFRDVIVASLDVPPSYIGLEENNSTKSTLSQESSLFARTVVFYQKIFTKHIYSLFEKVYRLIKDEQMIKCKITLPLPQNLLLESIADRYDVINRISESLINIDPEIPKEYIINKYSGLDMQEIELAKVKKKLDDGISGKVQDQSVPPDMSGLSDLGQGSDSDMSPTM